MDVNELRKYDKTTNLPPLLRVLMEYSAGQVDIAWIIRTIYKY